MTRLVEIITIYPNMFYVHQEDTYGGVRILISPGYELDEMLSWYRIEKERMKKELETRTKYPAAEEAFKNYQMVLSLLTNCTCVHTYNQVW